MKNSKVLTFILMACLILVSGGLLYASIYASDASNAQAITNLRFNSPNGIRYNTITQEFEIYTVEGMSYISKNDYISVYGEALTETEATQQGKTNDPNWAKATSTAKYKLMNDIECKNDAAFKSSRFYTNAPSLLEGGVFDGGGFMLSGFPIRKVSPGNTHYSAIFGGNSGHIKRLSIHVESINEIDTDGYVGGVAGFGYGSFTDITVYGLIVANSASIGGVFGGITHDFTRELYYTNLFNYANIINTRDDDGDYYSSGIGGWMYSNLLSPGKLVVSNCVNYGDIISTASNASTVAGGILGSISFQTTKVTLNGCKNFGTVRASHISGGIVGVTKLETTIIACSNSGIIVAANNGAGLVALSSGQLTISNSINAGNVVAAVCAPLLRSTVDFVDNGGNYNFGGCGTTIETLSFGSAAGPLFVKTT